MQKRFLLSICTFFIVAYASSQPAKTISRPKLVVGLVIDQMRWDYLYRFSDLYSANGFKRLLGEGFSCENTLIPYVPTVTAAGHTCIYTGSVPAINGIVGNSWFDREQGKSVYCADDSTVSPVGSTNTTWGKMSPRNLWTTTIGDELKLSNNFRSKVIGIALKDRASIFPAGHSANAAYWYDEQAGKWITSTYYMNDLPAWVKQMNDKKLPDAYMTKDWNTLLPIAKYDASTADDRPWEGTIKGETTSTFPHKISTITNSKYAVFRYTPFAVTYTFDLAKAAIENEKLGSNAVPDLLALSISTPDLIGHTFGPNSVEIEDTYLRLDNDIADFLKYLDDKIGQGNYVLFLTADHGVANVPAYLQENKIPAGVFNSSNLSKDLNQMLTDQFNIKNAVSSIDNSQVYLNYDVIKTKPNLEAQVTKAVINFLNQLPYVVTAFETEKISSTAIPEQIKKMVMNGYNPKRSGDIQFIIKPGYFSGSETGTTHGAWNLYDAHIPLLWFGWGIKQGKTNRETYMTDIASTLAALLKIQMPSGCVGKVIEEVMK